MNPNCRNCGAFFNGECCGDHSEACNGVLPCFIPIPQADIEEYTNEYNKYLDRFACGDSVCDG